MAFRITHGPKTSADDVCVLVSVWEIFCNMCLCLRLVCSGHDDFETEPFRDSSASQVGLGPVSLPSALVELQIFSS